MKFLSLIGFISTILFLFACASSPNQETHYFVLNLNQSAGKNTVLSAGEIDFQNIQLAKFLDQPGIVLQTEQHKVEIASFHRWAEPLKKNIHRYVSQSTGITANKGSAQRLEINILQFHGTQDGLALVSGYWKLDNVLHSFSYQAPLEEPGYAELVKQLAILLDQLCADIAAQIN